MKLGALEKDTIEFGHIVEYPTYEETVNCERAHFGKDGDTSDAYLRLHHNIDSNVCPYIVENNTNKCKIYFVNSRIVGANTFLELRKVTNLTTFAYTTVVNLALTNYRVLTSAEIDLTLNAGDLIAAFINYGSGNKVGDPLARVKFWHETEVSF